MPGATVGGGRLRGAVLRSSASASAFVASRAIRKGMDGRHSRPRWPQTTAQSPLPPTSYPTVPTLSATRLANPTTLHLAYKYALHYSLWLVHPIDSLTYTRNLHLRRGWLWERECGRDGSVGVVQCDATGGIACPSRNGCLMVRTRRGLAAWEVMVGVAILYDYVGVFLWMWALGSGLGVRDGEFVGCCLYFCSPDWRGGWEV